VSTKTGQVWKVFEKQFPGKGGKPGNTWYSIKLDGDETFYRCKGNNPGDIAGKVVSFEVDGDNVTSKPVIVQSAPAETAKAAPAAGAGGAGAVLGSTREASIHYQSARKDALQLVDIITRVGAVKLPAKEAAKLEAVEALVDSYTAQYFNDISTFGAVSRSNGTEEEAAKEVTTAEEEE
jgi:hypothetical protein